MKLTWSIRVWPIVFYELKASLADGSPSLAQPDIFTQGCPYSIYIIITADGLPACVVIANFTPPAKWTLSHNNVSYYGRQSSSTPLRPDKNILVTLLRWLYRNVQYYTIESMISTFMPVVDGSTITIRYASGQFNHTHRDSRKLTTWSLLLTHCICTRVVSPYKFPD